MKSKFIKTKMGNLHYLEEGSGGVLIFVPGIGITSTSFAALGKRLSEHYKVIIPDFYKGKSKMNVLPQSLSDYSDLLHEMINKLSLNKLTLIGWSMGGLIISSYAQKHPDNLNKIILLSSAIHHMSFMENPKIIALGYVKIIINNLKISKNVLSFLLRTFDVVENFIRSPKLVFSEIKIGMFDKNLVKVSHMPVPTKMLIDNDNEFISSTKLIQAHKNIKNLEIEIVNGGHDWFYHNEDLFLKKVREFL